MSRRLRATRVRDPAPKTSTGTHLVARPNVAGDHVETISNIRFLLCADRARNALFKQAVAPHAWPPAARTGGFRGGASCLWQAAPPLQPVLGRATSGALGIYEI